MTRVSDTADFATAVAEGGALPFLALACCGGRRSGPCWPKHPPGWGIGPGASACSASSPPELRAEQVEAIRAARPPFALIAGGRPDQARELEQDGIATYLHAPSPALLARYLRDGARRFVLEGRECGGHVGPRLQPGALGAGDRLPARRHRSRPRDRPRRVARPVRGGHSRRPLGGGGRRDGRPAGRARGEGRGAGRHGLPVHPRGGRDRGDRAEVPGRGRALPRDGAAEDGAGARGPRGAVAVHRDVRGRAATACGPRGPPWS